MAISFYKGLKQGIDILDKASLSNDEAKETFAILSGQNVSEKAQAAASKLDPVLADMTEADQKKAITQLKNLFVEKATRTRKPKTEAVSA